MPEAKYVSPEALDAYTQALSQKLNSKLSNIYTPKGSAIYADTTYLASANKASPAIDSVGLWQQINGNWTKLTEVMPGWVYNITNKFTTDANFIDGANIEPLEGINIVVINVGTTQNPVLKFDLLAVSTETDLSDYDTSAQVTQKIGNAIAAIPPTDLSDYDTSAEVTQKINDAIDAIPPTDLSDYDTSAEVDTKLQNLDIPTKQNKIMTDEPDVVLADLTYADAAARTADTTTNVSDGDIAYQEDTEEYYYAEVENSSIIWHDIGNTKTVEGAIKLIGNLMPIKPISTSEIQAMFA